MTSPCSLFWFRRDLRLADQPALDAAAGVGPVVAVFVSDPNLRRAAGAARLEFLDRSLAALAVDLDGALVHRVGDPIDVVPAVAAEVGATTVVAADDFGPYGRSRDDAVGQALAEAGRVMQYRGSSYAISPGSVRSGAGSPYRVFTPFFRAWKAHGWSGPAGTGDREWVHGIRSDPLPTPVDSGARLPVAGERAAWERLEQFLDGPVLDYAETRDRPAVDGTSRLSAYLKWGALHPRQLLDRLGQDPGSEVFRSELAWREFYADVLFHQPGSARTALVEKMALIEVDSGFEADRRFDAWCHGQTGFPIVDAGMRQLLAEGWMHNRVRMIVASFLVKDLHLDWTRGARWFMDRLVDGDLASNSHGWQWVAGTGTDASPYFRVFNPVTQSRRFDPTGEYLRRWIPELSHLADGVVHEPWSDKSGPPAGYPGPIVDHRAERFETLARYDRLKATWR